MSRALGSVPVGQFRNFASSQTCGPIDASQDTLHRRQHPIPHPLPPLGELGANAAQTLVWLARPLKLRVIGFCLYLRPQGVLRRQVRIDLLTTQIPLQTPCFAQLPV
jgi:hypothetical protein